jgi:glutamyl-tRNA synthetase
MKMFITRLAPTPSGFLHSGNLLNFRLIQHLKKLTGAKIYLRIDDLDSARIRDEYIEDIFRHLEWMKIDVDGGPSDVQDFKENFSQQLKLNTYKKGLTLLEQRGATLYQCRCSRKDIRQASPSGIYPGTCRKLNLSSSEAPVVRFETSAHTQLEQEHGDFVLWRRNLEPAYHLASVLDDLSLGVNFVIRGEDLEASTRVHKVLNSYFSPEQAPHYFHHPLVSSSSGEKLSKSQLNSAQQHFYSSGASLKQLEEQWDFPKLAELLEDELKSL